MTRPRALPVVAAVVLTTGLVFRAVAVHSVGVQPVIYKVVADGNDLDAVDGLAIPGRGEYHVPIGLSPKVRRDLEAFAPDVVHISSPDLAARSAARWDRKRTARCC